MDHARDVTIKLHHRVGKYLKINLYFAVKWIMLSEISFISGKCGTWDAGTLKRMNLAQNCTELQWIAFAKWGRPLEEMELHTYKCIFQLHFTLELSIMRQHNV